MKPIAAALCALALLAPRAARAQEPTPERLRAAGELLVAMHADSLMARTTEEMLRAQIRANPMMAPHEAVMREFFGKYMSWELLRPRMQRMYAEVYSEDELHQLAAFYATPLGRRLLETTPEIGRRSTEMSQALVMPHMAELVQSIMIEGPPAKPGHPAGAPAPR
jgi:hypothetical protein